MTQLPAYLLKRQSRTAVDDFTSGIGSSLPAHLSIADNRFTLVDASGNEKPVPTFHIDICIIGSNPAVSRVFYDPAKKFAGKGGDNGPPLCFSDNGTGPSKQSSMPQSPTCAVCPNAEWGSAVSAMTGRGIPACKSGKKLAFIVPGDADDIVYFLNVPPKSLTPLQKYVKTLAANAIGGRAAEPPDVITRVEFASQGVLKFNAVGLVDEDTFNRSEQVYATDVIAEVTGRNDVAIDPSRQLAAPIQTAALTGPAPQRTAPPAPFAPAAAGLAAPTGLPQSPRPSGTSMLPSTAAPAGGVTTVSPSDGGIPDFLRRTEQAAETAQEVLKEPAKPKATRKPKNVDAPSPIPETTTAVPGFLQRTEATIGNQKAAAATNFGMVTDAPAPSNDVNDALAKAFQLEV